MEVHIETISSGGVVTARIVLQGNSSIKEVSRLSLTQAQWEDFSKCLRNRPRVNHDKIVFAPVVPKEVRYVPKIDSATLSLRAEEVA